MTAPIYWIFLPAIFSILLFLIQNERTKYYLFIIINGLFVLTTLIVRIDPVGNAAFYELKMRSEMNVLGRSFILAEEDLFLIQLIHLINVIWGVLSYLHRKRSRIVPAGMLYSSMLLGAYAVSPFQYSALIIVLAVILSVPILIERENTKVNGITRYLVYQVLALPFILLAGWFLASGEITPVSSSQLTQATLLLGFGFVLWLGVFPFHSWIPLMYRDLNPINLGYILQLFLIIIFLVVLKFINGFSWLREYVPLFDAFLLLGIIMATFGALGIFFQKNLVDMIGYAFIHLIGMLLVVIGIFPINSQFLFPPILAVLTFNVIILHGSIAYIDNPQADKTVVLPASKKYEPLVIFGFIYVLLSLAGIPLTIGFPPQQWINQSLANSSSIYLSLLLFGKILIALSAIRLLKIVYEKSKYLKNIFPKDVKSWLFLGFLISIMIIGLFPDFVFRKFTQIVSGFENLIQ